MEMLAQARPIDARTALRWGLVNGVAEDTHSLERMTTTFVDRVLAACSPLGLRLTKQSLHAGLDGGTFDSALELEDRQQALCLNSDECREHAAAHLMRMAGSAKSKL